MYSLQNIHPIHIQVLACRKKKKKKGIFPSQYLVFVSHHDFHDIQVDEIPPSYPHTTSFPSLLKLETWEIQFPEFPVPPSKENDR